VDFKVQELSLEIGNTISELARVAEILDGCWLRLGLDEDLQADLNISVEEMLSNVIRHGSTSGEHPITLRLNVSAEAVRIEIQDSGVPFNPLDHPLPDPNAPLEQRRAGGLGIFMVIHMMDSVSYERCEGRNCLTMVRSRVRKT